MAGIGPRTEPQRALGRADEVQRRRNACPSHSQCRSLFLVQLPEIYVLPNRS